MRRVLVSASLALIAILTVNASVYAGDVHVSMRDGRVTLSARDATLKEILQAWAQAGRTSFVNLDGVVLPDRITLELNGVKEEDALAVLLRPLSGYVTVKRTATMTDASGFDRVVLLPTSVANHDSTVFNRTPPSIAPARPAAPPQTVIVNGVARIVGPNGALVEDDQVDAPPRPPQGFSRGDAAPTAPVQARPAPAAAPVGSAVPGVVNPAPQPPSSTLPAQR